MKTQWWEYLLALTFPAWGAVLIIFLLSILPQSLGIQTPLLFLGGIVQLFSAYPLFKLENIPLVIKILMVLGYYFISAFVIFIFGWGAYCVFYPSCH